MPGTQLAGQPLRAAIVEQGEQPGLPGVAFDAPAMVEGIAAALEAQAGADGEGFVEAVVPDTIDPHAFRLRIARRIEAAVRRNLAFHTHLTVKTADRP
ncbi:hypothetical protein D3C79_720710 [compost metagenome]